MGGAGFAITGYNAHEQLGDLARERQNYTLAKSGQGDVILAHGRDRSRAGQTRCSSTTVISATQEV